MTGLLIDMATLTIRLPDDKHNRLKELAQAKGISVSQEPQLNYTQEELVTAIVNPELFQEFLNWQRQATKKSLNQVFQ